MTDFTPPKRYYLPEDKGKLVFSVSITLLFFFIGLAGVRHHEMWLDELQAWLIARNSFSVGELFFNLRQENHPALWNLILYSVTRFTSNLFAMQLLHLFVATATVFVFVRYSPFNRLQKILFPFGYFALFEYGVISRSYALGVLLVFLFCLLFVKNKEKSLVPAILLALLANTSLYGFILAIAMFIGWVAEILIDKRIRKRLLVGSFLIFTAGATASVVQLLPPADSATSADVYFVKSRVSKVSEMSADNFKLLGYSVKTIWDGYFPLPYVFQQEFWNTNILLNMSGPVKPAIGVAASILIVGFILFLLVSRPGILLIYLVGTVSILMFTYLFHFGALRHHGHHFILFVSCLWLFSCKQSSQRFLIDGQSRLFAIASAFSYKFHKKYGELLFTAVLCVHLAAGVFALTMDILYPFSASKAAAEFIKSTQLADLTIIANPDFAVSPLSAHLDKRIYYLEYNEFGSFAKNHYGKKDLSSEEILRKTAALLTDRSEALLLVVNKDIPENGQPVQIEKLAVFSETIIYEEPFYIYKIKKR